MVRVHTMQLLSIPLFSCDSSSWAQNNIFGFVLFWNDKIIDKEDKTVKFFFADTMRDYFRENRKYWEDDKGNGYQDAYIKSLGFTYSDLMGPDKHHYRQLLNAIYYLRIEEEITKKRQHQLAVAV